MDERQRLAAQVALEKVDKERLFQKIELQHRARCIEDVNFFKLPYRILHDLHQPPDQIPRSRFYPLLGPRRETEEAAKAALQAARERPGTLTAEQEIQIISATESRDHTPPELREYFFTCFLSGWDLSAFAPWEWTGQQIPSAEADRLRQYFILRQGKFEDAPQEFSLPVLKKDADLTIYSNETQKNIDLIGLLD